MRSGVANRRERILYREVLPALVSQLAEETDSKPVQCGFESHRGHQRNSRASLSRPRVSVASNGAGNLGGAQATGLATLSDDEFGGGPAIPTLPKTWDPETPKGEGER